MKFVSNVTICTERIRTEKYSMELLFIGKNFRNKNGADNGIRTRDP